MEEERRVDNIPVVGGGGGKEERKNGGNICLQLATKTPMHKRSNREEKRKDKVVTGTDKTHTYIDLTRSE